MLIHVLILRRIEGAPMIMSLLATYALSTILVNVAILIWGAVTAACLACSAVRSALSGRQCLDLAAGVVCLRDRCQSGRRWLLQFTRFGRAVRSASQAPELASISGICGRSSSARDIRAWLRQWPDLPACWSRRRSPSIPSWAPGFIIKAFAVIIVGGMGATPAPFWPRCFIAPRCGRSGDA